MAKTLRSGDPAVQYLLDKDSIRDVLTRYCRGIDRVDSEVLESVFWPDAPTDYFAYVGLSPGFVDFMMEALPQIEQTTHMIGNILLNMAGEKCEAETYVQAYHRMRAPASPLPPGSKKGTPWDFVLGARYIDHFEKRDDEWRIARRYLCWDWCRNYSDSFDPAAGMLGLSVPRGGLRKPDDEIYKRFSIPTGFAKGRDS
ncbi:MAG TPA: nuclear transport factor 2 family protein [Steroidobacteraceae bacterium]|jgi:hypothetical protein